jgi:hypothetical protein
MNGIIGRTFVRRDAANQISGFGKVEEQIEPGWYFVNLAPEKYVDGLSTGTADWKGNRYLHIFSIQELSKFLFERR